MKNAMKKIMSLVLVAMILVSALPVAASAAGHAFTVNVNNGLVYAEEVSERERVSYDEIISLSEVDTAKFDVAVNYDVIGGNSGTLEKGQSITLDAPVNVWITATEKQVNDDNDNDDNDDNDRPNYPGRPDNDENNNNRPGNNDHNRPGRPGNDDENNNRPSRPENDNNRPGNNDNNHNGNNDHNRPGHDDDEGYGKFSNEVWLYIYTGNSIGEPNKRVLITDGIAADGKVTLNEVKSVVKYYYNAVDADTGITYDGIYPMQGGWVDAYIKDRKYNTVDGLYQAAAKQTVILRVMIGNAKLATTTSAGSNADNSNPKTGDQISMAITTMAVSASVLALGFYFTKKRAY